MKQLRIPILVLIALFVLFSPFIFFTIGETEQAVVIQLGKPVKVIVNPIHQNQFEEIAEEIRSATEASVSVGNGPGLYMRVPFIQTVEKVDARIIEFDEQPRDIVTVDKYQLSIDSYARWRIRNPLLFYLRVQDEAKATLRLRAVVGSELRKELGRQSHYEIIRSSTKPIQVMGIREGEYEIYNQPVHEGREVLMQKVTESCDLTSRKYGIEVVDVRIKRADLPMENAESVYRRMIEERNRIANRYRMEGERESNIIRSETDRTVKAMLANAEKERLRIRGDADAKAAQIYWEGYEETLEDGSTVMVEGFGSEPDFFKFYRSLQALKKTITQQDNLILSTDSPLFEYLNLEGSEFQDR
ncbi:MAG: protease modulator HflC [Candidatus Omnitrophica bacterium]|nr:protease modulator HflC [Candidatus Omnitrophota bacterium]